MSNTTNDAAETATSQEPDASTSPVDSGEPQAENQPAGGSRTYTQAQLDRTIKARVDKQNEKHAAEIKGLSTERDKALERAKTAEARVAELEAESARAKAVVEAAAEKNVDATILARMAGDTADEITANAELLANVMPRTAYPDVPDAGGAGAAPPTREQIEAIKDEGQRVDAIAANPDLFR